MIEVVDSLANVSAAEWNRLAGGDPFLSHEFLSALHDTGCAAPATGWTPQFVIMKSGGTLNGAMPLYLKDHSYGEYVFDWGWADAYYRHGHAYYPKLLSAIPFTPVTGSRLLASTDADSDRLVAAALQLARSLRVSSLHCLFPRREQVERMRAHGMMLRHGVQFHWANDGYTTFDDFLGALNHTKRKKIKQERRKVADAGITFRWIEGADITDREWAFFNRCYRQTYREHRSTPYLNLEFFRRIGRVMPQHVVLFLAMRAGDSVAASLHIRHDRRLCGRYWGAIEYHPVLHFESCYYQAIEYCIARGIAAFEGGAQGEHKMARGLMPVETCSAHWLARPEFAQAIEQFLARESHGMARYIDELSERTPFKSADGAPSG
ncbi:MAG TPA: GNAT family N-acetyltransferase [Burkholderiales bacterium]|nr:GNAT family N-acetyltransferase [Burkholderiales bacterium]